VYYSQPRSAIGRLAIPSHGFDVYGDAGLNYRQANMNQPFYQGHFQTRLGSAEFGGYLWMMD
jgi:hypothetical protein